MLAGSACTHEAQEIWSRAQVFTAGLWKLTCNPIYFFGFYSFSSVMHWMMLFFLFFEGSQRISLFQWLFVYSQGLSP